MYKTAKKILSKVVSRRQLLQYEVFLRKGYGVLYSGTACHCTLCNKKLRYFIPMPANNLLCPTCGSLSPDRRLWIILNEGLLKSGIRILDFSPSRPMFRKLKHVQDIHYSSTNLSGNFIADHAYDITALDVPDASLDLIICYDILQYITDDITAMAELYRVLKTGGTALIQTPFSSTAANEDTLINEPEVPVLQPAQKGKSHTYTVIGLTRKLEKAGFGIEVRNLPESIYNGLTAETVIVAYKK